MFPLPPHEFTGQGCCLLTIATATSITMLSQGPGTVLRRAWHFLPEASCPTAQLLDYLYLIDEETEIQRGQVRRLRSSPERGATESRVLSTPQAQHKWGQALPAYSLCPSVTLFPYGLLLQAACQVYSMSMAWGWPNPGPPYQRKHLGRQTSLTKVPWGAGCTRLISSSKAHSLSLHPK